MEEYFHKVVPHPTGGFYDAGCLISKRIPAATRQSRTNFPTAGWGTKFSVALVVGGSIVVPHLRRAVELLDELEKEQ
jgi:hypothetical protein